MRAITALTAGPSKDVTRLNQVGKTLRLLEADPKHRGLQSHRFQSLDSVFGEAVWESYIENHTPPAWRIWWFFGPERDQITIVALGPHP